MSIIIDFEDILAYCGNMKNVITQSVSETHQLAQSFVEELSAKNRIICLTGDLGSGKTTFTQGLLGAFGAQKPYTSPTFTIMKEYDVKSPTFSQIYHIDAYRITGNDMVELGWSDIVADEKTLIIVEWPEHIKDILPEAVQKISCTWISDNERKYVFQ